MSAAIQPGAWLGVLGGGQLGRMFCQAAQAMGYRVCVLEPVAKSPAGVVADREIVAAYDDEQALSALANLCSAVTTEFENVPARALEFLASKVPVSPGARPVSIAQDRIAEKEFIRSQGIAVAPFAAIRTAADIEALPADLLPGILKSARMGYDGKGQVRVDTFEQVRAAWLQQQSVPCVLERALHLRGELSCVVVRARDGTSEAFTVASNQHRNGILAVSTVPAPVAPALTRAATECARRVAQALDYVGVLCVEFFVVVDGSGEESLVVNEMAPRPHNSGHYTIDACVTSQFEQQVRAMCNLPLGSTRLLTPAVMLNVLGDAWRPDEPPWHAAMALGEVKVHLYGKTQARPGRKMGHVTVLGASAAEAASVAQHVQVALGL